MYKLIVVGAMVAFIMSGGCGLMSVFKSNSPELKLPEIKGRLDLQIAEVPIRISITGNPVKVATNGKVELLVYLACALAVFCAGGGLFALLRAPKAQGSPRGGENRSSSRAEENGAKSG